MFRSLRYRDFALFWTGNFLSNIGTWMQNLALGWQILVMTNSPFLLGLNGFLGTLPSLVFSLPGGAIADRLNRRKLMIFTQTSMAVLALVLGVLTSLHVIRISEILAISFLTGLASALNNPAYQALVPDLVERDDLVNAVALNSAQFNMSRAIGPTLAGLAFVVLMPLFARDLLKVGASGLGYLMAGAGLGAVLSALTLAAQKSAERKGTFIITSAAVFSLALILLAHAHSFWWAFFLLMVLGSTMVGALALTNTTLQLISPPELRGRIMSFYTLTVMGLSPLGSLWVGSVAEVSGTRFALTLGGAICLTYFLILLASLPRLRRIARLPWPEDNREPEAAS